jgi:hypothetical protein
LVRAQLWHRAGQSWYAYNLLEEITQPGEWYLDRSTGLLYIWPNAGFASAEIQVSVLNGPLFSLNGASYITLQNLQLESTRAGLIAVRMAATPCNNWCCETQGPVLWPYTAAPTTEFDAKLCA